VVEAKKDDFEQGLAQCLVALHSCQTQNKNAGLEITVYGIVTNGDGWRFYCLKQDGSVLETPLIARQPVNPLLGVLNTLFKQSVTQLTEWGVVSGSKQLSRT
jgi:hypothetical protein